MKHLLYFLLINCYLSNAQPLLTAEADCPNAYRLCDATATYYVQLLDDGDIDDAHGSETIPGMFRSSLDQFESKSAWLKFTPNYTGQFGLVVQTESNENIDFQIHSNTDCGTIESGNFTLVTNVYLNTTANNQYYSGIGVNPTTNSSFNWNNWMTVQAGTEYVMLVTTRNYLQTGVHRFWLTFQGNVVTQHPDLFDHPSCQLATNSVLKEYKNVRVSPNPFTDTIAIKTDESISKIEVYSLLGKKVKELAFTQKIDLSSLAKGVYFMKLYGSNDAVFIKKIIKK